MLKFHPNGSNPTFERSSSNHLYWRTTYIYIWYITYDIWYIIYFAECSINGGGCMGDLADSEIQVVVELCRNRYKMHLKEFMLNISTSKLTYWCPCYSEYAYRSNVKTEKHVFLPSRHWISKPCPNRSLPKMVIFKQWIAWMFPIFRKRKTSLISKWS